MSDTSGYTLRSLASWVVAEFQPRDFVPSLATAAVCYFLKIIFAVSFAALIFQGVLAPYLAFGVGMTLFTAFAAGIVITLFSSLPVSIAIPSDRTAPILAVLAGAVIAYLPAGSSPVVVASSAIGALLLATFLTGLFLALLGKYKLGRLVRFIPFPVVGGFMAGAGWLMCLGALRLMLGHSITPDSVSLLFEKDALIRWLPAFLLAPAMVLASRHWKNSFTIPVCVVVSIVIFYAIVLYNRTSVSSLRLHGFLPEAFPASFHYDPVSLALLQSADWNAIVCNGGILATILLVSAISVLLITSALELSAGNDIDGDNELKAAGLANLASVAGGGIVGLHSLSISTLVLKMGPRSRWVGLLTALGAGATLLFGPGIVSYLPVPVLGLLVFFLGFNFLAEWVLESYWRVSRSDYLIIWIILITIGFLGYIQGVGVGLLVAAGLFALRYSKVDVVRQALSGTEHQSNVDRTEIAETILKEKKRSIYVLKLQGFIFFGTAYSLLENVKLRVQSTANQPKLRFLIIDFRYVTGLDSSTLICFLKLRQIARQEGFFMVICNLNQEVIHTLQKNPEIMENKGLVIVMHPDLDHAFEWCENQILADYPEACDFADRKLESQLQQLLQTSPEIVSRLIRHLERMELAAGTVLAEQGSEAHELFFIESGQIAAQMTTRGGDKIRLRTMSAGSIVGEIGLYLRLPRSAGLVVERDSVIYRLTLEQLQRLNQEDPQAALAFHEYLARLLASRVVRSNEMLGAHLR